MSRRTAPCVAVMLLVSTAAAGRADDSVVIDRIAAVVGEEIILLSDVRRQAGPQLREVEKARKEGADLMADKRRKDIVKETLEQMIDDAIVNREAREMKLEVTTDEVDRAMENMAKENGIDLDTLKEAIKAQGMDLVTYRAKLRSQILRFKVLNLRVRGRVKVTDAEARQYYNDQVRDVRATGTYEGAHILVRVGQRARALDVARARKQAEVVKARLVAGEDFARVAAEASDDKSTAAGGGGLGRVQPGTLPGVLDRAFLDLEVGELAGPIRSPAGFHIMKLLARDALGVQSFAEVRERIVAQLTQAEMTRQEKMWLREVRLRTFIDVRL